MTSWGLNSSVTFRHGRLERKELNKNISSRRSENFVERTNRGGSLHIPGVTLSTNFERYAYLQFSHGFNLWRQDRVCYPELVIMQLINIVTDRENWQVDIDDFSICRSWKDEAIATGFPDNNDLWDWCLYELRKKASEFTASPRGTVFVLDSASRVCKSDRWVGSSLYDDLKLDTESIDLSPWMLPYVFGVSPIRTTGQHITLDNFLDCMTVGAVRAASGWDPDRLNNGDPSFYSGKSQWLATAVSFSSEDSSVTIKSPINNLHPVEQKRIYTAVEHLVADVIDDWNHTLLYKALPRGVSRIIPSDNICRACSAGNFEACSCRIDFREYSAWANGREDNVAPRARRERNWNPVLALDGAYSTSKKIYDNVSLRDGFKDRELQIYVEIATINVNPNGSVSPDSVHHLGWDLNGNRNERIVASTVICLRRDNIQSASGGISFRTETKRNVWGDPSIGKQKSRKKVVVRSSSAHSAPTIQPVAGPSSASHGYAVQPVAGPSSAPHGPATQAAQAADSDSDEPEKREPEFQELGTVKLPEGRLVSYPNALQHKFEAPKLKEPAKSGRLQFMQIHLVDPHYVVCSTRFVPPQSLNWWKEAVEYEDICRRKKLPGEIAHTILERLFVPDRWLNRKKTVRGLKNYWQIGNTPAGSQPDAQLRQPPVMPESAIRRKQQAIQRHDFVMRAVNGPKVYGRPNAFTVWLQTVLRNPPPTDNSAPQNPASLLLSSDEDDDEEDDDEDDETSSDENDAANNFADTEEEDLPEWDDLLDVDASSGSEGSTDGEDKPKINARLKGKGRAVDSSSGSEGGADEAGKPKVSGRWKGKGRAVDDGCKAMGSGDETYYDAQYGLTLKELAENMAETQPEIETETRTKTRTERQTEIAGPAEVEEEMESLYDDAMSHADELEEEDLEAGGLGENESDANESDGDEGSAWDLYDSEMSGLEASDVETVGPGEYDLDEDEMAQ